MTFQTRPIRIRPQRCNVAGFTIPEMLAVVALIIIIIAMLMPSLQRASYQARVAICVSNKHQIMVGVRSYSTDNINRFPNAQGGGNVYWMQDMPHIVFTAGRDHYGVPLEMWGCAASENPRLPYHWGGYNPYQKWKMTNSAWWVIRGTKGSCSSVQASRPFIVSDRSALVPGDSVLVSEYIRGSSAPTSSPHSYKGEITDGAVGRADGSAGLIRVEDMKVRLPNEGWGPWWY